MHNHDDCTLLPFSAQPFWSAACPGRGRHQPTDLRNTVQRHPHIITYILLHFFHQFTAFSGSLFSFHYSHKLRNRSTSEGMLGGIPPHVVDAEDLKPIPPSDIHVKRFKSKEVEVPKTDKGFFFRHAKRAQSCKKGSRHPPLCPKRRGDPLQENENDLI